MVYITFYNIDKHYLFCLFLLFNSQLVYHTAILLYLFLKKEMLRSAIVFFAVLVTIALHANAKIYAETVKYYRQVCLGLHKFDNADRNCEECIVRFYIKPDTVRIRCGSDEFATQCCAGKIK
jgi:hypothetical protein